MPTGTYVYCLVAGRRRPPVRHRAAGLPGMGPVRVVDVELDAAAPDGRGRSRTNRAGHSMRKWLVVADAPLTEYSEDRINRRLSNLDWMAKAAVAHEAVVESFLDAAALLPMKLFTIFTSDSRALEYLQRQRTRIRRLIDRVAGQQEWGVRVTFASTGQERVTKQPRNVSRSASGAAYLSLKKAQRDRAAGRSRHARKTVADLYDRLEAQAVAAKRRAASEMPMQGGPLLLDAAFLVPRSRSVRFRALVARQARSLAVLGYRLAITGPWPPYSFIQD